MLLCLKCLQKRLALLCGRISLAAIVLVACIGLPDRARAQVPVTAVDPSIDGSFENDGIRLYYRTQGTGAPIVLLSGGPGITVDYLFALGELFPKSYRMVYLEQRGTGRSVVGEPSRATLNMDAAVGDLEALRRHLQVERLLLAGHSYGGMLAMAYAAKYPTRVERLMLISSGGPTARFFTYFGGNIVARLRYEEKAAQKYWRDEMSAGRVSRQKGVNEVQAVATPTYFFDRDKGLAFVRAAPEPVDVRTMELIQADFETYDVREGLKSLDAPTLVVHGYQDPIGDLTAEEIRSSIRNATVQYLNRCGHFPWLEQPDALRKLLAEFLAP